MLPAAWPPNTEKAKSGCRLSSVQRLQLPIPDTSSSSLPNIHLQSDVLFLFTSYAIFSNGAQCSGAEEEEAAREC